MSAIWGWTLAVLAVAAGYVGFGWPGVVLAVTVVIFWLLLQFSRALRVMRQAAGRPMGQVDNAVMLHSRLQDGMTLPQIMKLTQSFGLKRGDDPESFAWRDAGGDEVVVEMKEGRLGAWRLQRAESAPADA